MKFNITFNYEIDEIIGDEELDLLISKREFNQVFRDTFIEFIELEIQGVFSTGEVPDIIIEKLIEKGAVR